MEPQTKPTINRERPFDVHEMFFSTTDLKGLLTAWNGVFARVSGYSPEELAGEPHNIVRHPDMPRCVFKLLWDYLLAGKPIGAYVKNRAKSGEFYWVFALASPHRDGFLSIRLKPTSPLLSTVEKLYAELLTYESEYGRDRRAGMNESSSRLMQQLAALNFRNYDEFMTHALRAEFLARRAASASSTASTQNQSVTIVEECGKLLQLRERVTAIEQYLETFVSKLSLVALNSGARAVRLGDLGKALAVIGQEVARLAGSIREQASHIQAKGTELADALQRVAFEVTLATLQLEMATAFASEGKQETRSAEEQERSNGRPLAQLETELLHAAEGSTTRAAESGRAMLEALRHFGSFVESFGRFLLTIQFSHVTGKTLAAQLPGGREFATLLEDLVSLSAQARDEILALGGAVKASQEVVGQWELGG